MAPPTFPNGLSLYSIGFAALKYPALPPPPVDVPLGNVVGVLQRLPTATLNQMVAQIASQYIAALLEYQTSDEPTLHDPSLPQYYFSTALCLINLLASNPDVSKRAAGYPNLVNNVIEKLLAPDFIDGMKRAPRLGGAHFPAATFDADFGSVLQFLSTMLLYREEIESTLHPRIKELIPKLRTWKRTYRHSPVKTISNASERLVIQIEGMDPTMIAMTRGMQEKNLVCGVASCGVTGAKDLTVCSQCRIQRYCGKDHQKLDWRYHKNICKKGLQEPEPATAAGADAGASGKATE